MRLKTILVFFIILAVICGESLAVFEHRTDPLDPGIRAVGGVCLGKFRPLQAIENPAYLVDVKRFAMQLEYANVPFIRITGFEQGTNNGSVPQTPLQHETLGMKYFPITAAFRMEQGVFGLSILYMDMGEWTKRDDLGCILGYERYFNIDVGVQYSSKIRENVFLGSGVRWGYEQRLGSLGCRSIARGLTWEIGCVVNDIYENVTLQTNGEGKRGLTLDFSLRNIGLKEAHEASMLKYYPPWEAKLNLTWMVVSTKYYYLQAGIVFKMLLVDYLRS